MTRRGFSVALAGAVAAPRLVYGRSVQVVTLHAIAGARLPETLAVTTNSPERMRESVWELRTYRAPKPSLAGHLAAIFPRAGIRPVLRTMNGLNLTYLIPFENL